MRDLFTKDLGWKLFSLFLATVLWLVANRILRESAAPLTPTSSSPVIYDKLPVVIVAEASDVHFYRVAPSTVSVTVNGSPDAIAVLQANQIRATVNLTDIKSGNELKRRVDVSVPQGITLISVDPPKVGVIIPPQTDQQP